MVVGTGLTLYAVFTAIGHFIKGAFTLAKDIVFKVIDVAFHMIAMAFRFINAAFSALPMALKFVFGIMFMFIAINMIVFMAFGFTNYCDTQGVVHHRSFIRGVTMEVANLFSAIMPDQDTVFDKFRGIGEKVPLLQFGYNVSDVITEEFGEETPKTIFNKLWIMIKATRRTVWNWMYKTATGADYYDESVLGVLTLQELSYLTTPGIYHEELGIEMADDVTQEAIMDQYYALYNSLSDDEKERWNEEFAKLPKDRRDKNIRIYFEKVIRLDRTTDKKARLIEFPDGRAYSVAATGFGVGNTDYDETKLFSASCLMNDDKTDYKLDVGIYGKGNIFTFQTFLIATVIFLILSFVGYLFPH